MPDAPTNWIDFYISLSPVAGTAIWAGVAVAAIVAFRKSINRMADVFVQRVKQGDNIKTPWISLERDWDREREVVQAVTESIRSELEGSSGSEHEVTSIDISKINEALDLASRNFVKVLFPNRDFPSIRDHDTTISRYITDWSTVSDFLNDIYVAAVEYGLDIPVWTYGEYWQLRNARTGNVIEKMAKDLNFDSRRFAEIDVLPGDRLIAERCTGVAQS